MTKKNQKGNGDASNFDLKNKSKKNYKKGTKIFTLTLQVLDFIYPCF